MSRFYLLLWFNWAWRLTLNTLIFSTVFTLVITGLIYANQGFATLSSEVFAALFDIAFFWFAIVWNIALLLVLFRGLKGIFNICHASYVLELYSCPDEGKSEKIYDVGYGDLVKVWRKWFMLVIWIVGTQMIFSVVLSALFSSSESVFDWFNIYVLYGFILVAGYLSFMILGSRCKRVKIKKC